MAHAAGTFTVKSWAEDTYRELGEQAKLTKATVEFTMEGDLAAEASWDAVMCYRPDGTAVFSGFQYTSGSIGGQQGSFVLQTEGEFAAGEARTRWRVVEGSGTGGLSGLTGFGFAIAGATPPGSYTFDYSLG
jgi:hypothetical protein